ncbi:uncharacterized protein Z518_05574 [Rhinocladiella mackenziei CBS 650.93]|uniref:JmjC domain-containing protein n=1 Tax=Rhinocladiella mackenziei CBS 650.93 TaxID=1442369 RepID=A0A0D2IFW7_9EURO|nr:uncharacterized protein Z518_05574 [Rhinocladiella mackenziei CBS 650.93]KIX04704.1 hypothetical protein Z518_05574 [Rhinocladiella mackenziei CBS 650.93]
MPSTRPCAAFEPISPEFDLKALVESTANFEWVVRIHCDMIDRQGLENFEKLVLIHVILGGKPLVIEGYESRLDRWTFTLQWLRDNCGSKVEHARDLTKKANVPLSIGHYLNNMAPLTNQWTARNYKDPQRQRMYLKDIDCPQLWHDKLAEIIPRGLFYLDDTTGDIDGFGEVDANDPTKPGMTKGHGIAKAGDLMSSLPKEMRAENLMCYIGHEGTYTPAHREMCASLGQNIMVEASTGLVEDGKLTKPGSSIWFMTESKEREVVSEYWLSRLGHDIEIENHFAQINAWKTAPFKTYVVEQKPGDFILIPPLAPHQVWNRGTRTMKVAWNRTTVETLEMAMHEALPRARMVCRDEQYKNKAIVFYTMRKYSKLLRTNEKMGSTSIASGQKPQNDTKVRRLEKDFRRLQTLFTEILVSESFLENRPEKNVEKIPYDSNITCSYCRCNIFNRFLTCPNCVEAMPDGEEDTYDICMECYAIGRSCACISKLRWAEQWTWKELTQKHEQWRRQILQYDGQLTEKSPMSLKSELDRLGKKRTLAQICQLELARRPFRDIRRPASPVTGDDRVIEEVMDADGNVRKKKKIKRSEKFVREHARCHVDMHWEPKWKQASCATCDKNYCYGLLFRAYDMMPQDILADPDWQCPSCRGICGCRNCRSRPDYKPYIPSGTILGHNTKAIADPRSVESLVDFSYSNIGWIQKAGDDNGDDTRRLKKRRKEADAAKANDPELGDDYVNDHEDSNDRVENEVLRQAQREGIPIDPALAASVVDENPEGPRRYRGPPPTHAQASHYVVPEGGVIRDVEHAYDLTEAITYDYPGPQLRHQIPIIVEKAPPGSAPVTDDIRDIGIVERKRRKTRIDEEHRAYHYQKGSSERPKKQRKSLQVKLPVNRDKLEEVKMTAATARRALNRVEASAPVLNAAEGNPQQLPTRVRMNDHVVVERDDDFTPVRHRDRRKAAPDGVPRPSSDAEITRRQTRMQAVHNEGRSEEEFDEMLPKRPKWPKRQKNGKRIVRLDDADFDDLESEAASAGGDTTDDEDSALESSPRVEIVPDPPLTMNEPRPIAKQITAPEPRQSSTQRRQASFSTTSSPEPPPKRTKLAKSPAVPVPGTSQPLAKAQANRRAKMAAIEWMNNDGDSLDDAWSQESLIDA